MIDSTSRYPTSEENPGKFHGCLTVFYSISLHLSSLFTQASSSTSIHHVCFSVIYLIALLLTLHYLSSLPDRRLSSNNRESSIQFDEYSPGDKVMFEIDIRSYTPSERTMHLFINGRQQKPYAINLPPYICFITHLYAQNDYMTFNEYQRVSHPTHTHIGYESPFACQ